MDELTPPLERTIERWTRLAGLYVLAPLLLVLSLPSAVHISQAPEWGMKVRDLQVVSVSPTGPAVRAGIQTGDVIESIEGRSLSSMPDYYVAKAGRYSLQPFRLTLRRGALVISTTLVPVPAARAEAIWHYSVWLSGIAFLLMGVWVLSRRNDPVARNFYLLSMIFAFFLIDVPDWPSATYIQAKELLRGLLNLLLPAFFLRFMLHFPSQGNHQPRSARLDRLLLLPVLPLYLGELGIQGMDLGPGAPFLAKFLQYAVFLYFVTYFVTGLAVFARKILRRDRPIQHTKLRVVLLGLLAGLIPFLAASFLANFYPDTRPAHWEYLSFSLVLVPLSFGLAILRYGALDTAFVIRYSLTYGTLTILLLLTYFVIVGLLGKYLATYSQVSTYPLALITVAGSALAILPARRGLQNWIDRAFYPARRANRVAILTLAQELSGLLDSQRTTETLLDRLAGLYRPERLSLFLHDENGQQFIEKACFANGEAVPGVFAFPIDSPLTHHLDRVRRPTFAEDIQEAAAIAGPDSGDLSFLKRLGAVLLVPLVTGNQLSGVLAFGPKGSGSLYTQDDLTNLRLLSIQAAALLESRRLYEESLARKQLETELAVAKEIQGRLLPTGMLDLGGIQICGCMESCHEVGGDYFDYFPLDAETIGFAIADVAGKGIPAALLMASLRVSFRSEAAHLQQPEQVVSRLNEAVCNMKAPGQFICFFYGTYSITEHVLRYCNAGMEPPILFRRDPAYLQTLRKGGPVLGVDPQYRYRRGVVALRESDLLLGFTDGLTDQTNATGEFFDPERLIATVRNHLEQPIEQLRDTILKTVSVFGGSDRTDDRTLMLLKVGL